MEKLKQRASTKPKPIIALFSILASGLLILSTLNSCISIPRETVTLSEIVGKDIQALQASHRSLIDLYYGGIEKDINHFIDHTYTPFIINYVLEKESQNQAQGKASIFGTLQYGAEHKTKKAADSVLKEVSQFQLAASRQIASKRNELLQPIQQQKRQLLQSVQQLYQNISYANSTLTAYLKSAQKVKESQSEALRTIGLEGVDSLLNQKLIKFSQDIQSTLEKGNQIDIKGKEALDQIEKVSREIKSITNSKSDE